MKRDSFKNIQRTPHGGTVVPIYEGHVASEIKFNYALFRLHKEPSRFILGRDTCEGASLGRLPFADVLRKVSRSRCFRRPNVWPPGPSGCL